MSEKTSVSPIHQRHASQLTGARTALTYGFPSCQRASPGATVGARSARSAGGVVVLLAL